MRRPRAPRRARRRPASCRRKHARDAWLPAWAREILGRLGYFLLACLVGFGILLAVTAPLIFGVWLLLRYAAAQ
jgi:hypothetical protein